MCFNAPYSWQLGWYADKSTTLDPFVTPSWSGRLVGLAEYDKAEGTENIIVKVETGTEIDYYLGFNRQTGINSETQEGGDQVLISTKGLEGEAFAKSILHAKVSAGGSFEMTGFGGRGLGMKVQLVVNEINLSVSPAYARVTITRSGSQSGSVFLNCGGTDDYDDGTNVWRSDSVYVNSGNIYYPPGVDISNTLKPEIYRSERYGPDLVYSIPLSAGDYDILMHFAEIYFDYVGARVFRVEMNGSVVFPDVDIVRDADGAFKAHIKTVPRVSVTNGVLQIELKGIVQLPKVSRILSWYQNRKIVH
jgi:hypothetical protein